MINKTVSFINYTLEESTELKELKVNGLYLGDSFYLMNLIPDNSIDLVLSDPPFLYVSGGCKNRAKNKEITEKLGGFGKVDVYNMLDLVDKKLKKMNSYFFCSRLQIPFYLNWCTEHKYKFDVLVWNKDRIDIKTTKTFCNDIEYVIRIYDVGVNLNKLVEDGVTKGFHYTKLKTYKSPKNVGHLTPKPIELLEEYIRLSSNEGDLVLDPFAGSGSLALACINLKREYICIERDMGNFQESVKRLGLHDVAKNCRIDITVQ